MRRVVLPGLLAAVGCETSDAVVARKLGAWHGRPVAAFVSELAWPPEHVIDQGPGKRTYVFRRYAMGHSCGATLWASAAPGGQYVIERTLSDCGPSAF